MFFLNSKIGEEQSAEDAEDGPPELLVYIDFFLCKMKCHTQTGLFVIVSCIWKSSQDVQILSLEDDFKLKVIVI